MPDIQPMDMHTVAAGPLRGPEYACALARRVVGDTTGTRLMLIVPGRREGLVYVDNLPTGNGDGLLAAIRARTRQAPDSVMLAVVDDTEPVHCETVVRLLGRLRRAVVLADVLVVHGDRWRSLACRDRECCPPPGRRRTPRWPSEGGLTPPPPH